MNPWGRNARQRLRFTAIALAIAFAALALASLAACGQAQSQWTKAVEVSSVIEGSSRNSRFADGRCITVDVKQGGDVRFLVTVGTVHGVREWTSGPPKFYCKLLGAEEDPVTPGSQPEVVELDTHVATESVNEPDDVKRYDIRTAAQLDPGTYNFVYDGAGSVRIVVYSRQ